MADVTVTTRAGKGLPLSHEEMDANFTDLANQVNQNSADNATDHAALDARLDVVEPAVTTLQTNMDLAEASVADHESRVTTLEAHASTTVGNPHAVSKTDVGLSNVSNDAQLKRAGADYTGFTEKAAPVAADEVLIEDSDASGAKKKVQLVNLQDAIGLSDVTNDAQLKRADGDIASFTEKAAPVAADLLLIEDSEATNAKKKIQLGSIDLMDLTNMPGYAAGDAGKVMAVNDTEDGLEFRDVTATDLGGYGAADFWRKQELGQNNLFINGCLRVWQRGASFTTGDEYTADRWLAYNKTGVNTGVANTAMFPERPYYLELVRSSSGAVPGIIHRIEADVARHYVGKQLTVSLWAYAPAGTTGLGVQLQTATSANDFSSRTTQETALLWNNGSAPSNWTYLQYTFAALPSEAANGFEVRFYRGNTEASTTRFCMLKLEEGTVATPFVPRPMATEVKLCQRYYEKGDTKSGAVGSAYGTAYLRGNIRFVVPKIVGPTVTLSGQQYFISSWNSATVNSTAVDTEGFTWTLNGTFTLRDAYIVDFTWTADSEL